MGVWRAQNAGATRPTKHTQVEYKVRTIQRSVRCQSHAPWTGSSTFAGQREPNKRSLEHAHASLGEAASAVQEAWVASAMFAFHVS